jgi:hypothetical protein
MNGFALAKEDGEQINFRGTRMLIKVSNDDSEGRYSIRQIFKCESCSETLNSRKELRQHPIQKHENK